MTVAIWLRDGGISNSTSVGAILTSAGRITGLLGAYLLLLQVLFLARLPFLQWVIPFDRLTVIHRLNGKICLYLILAHVALVVAGYAVLDRISVLTEAWTVVTTYPGMIAATVGTILLLVVVVTSLVIVRARLRYETWFLVHLTAYAAVILAWFHQIPTGNDFLNSPVAAAFWTALYVATLQLVIIFRLVFSVARAVWHGLRVAEVRDEGGGATSILITGRSLAWLNASSGQFFQWRFLDRHRWFEAHPFSLSAAPDENHLRITVKALGDFTSRLSLVKPGTFVIADGPFGGFTEDHRSRHAVALIAGGIGITAVRALLEDMRDDVTVIYRAIDESELIFRQELDSLAQHRGIKLHYVVGDHRLAEHRDLMTAPHLKRIVSDITDREIFLCGPPGMVTAVERSLRQLGIRGRQIHTEKFAL